MHAHLYGPRTLAAIAIFKFVKAALLIVVALLLYRLRYPHATEHLAAWLGAFPIATGHEVVSRGIDWMLGISTHTMSLFALVALAYAALYTVEGVGLWRNADWAKYLTVISTSLLVPIEVFEMFKHFTPMKLSALVINLAIVAYLVRMLYTEKAAQGKHRAIDARSEHASARSQ